MFYFYVYMFYSNYVYMRKFYSFVAICLFSINALNAQYCASAATSTADEDIFNVSLGGLSNTTNCTTAPPAGTLNMYSNFTASGPTTNLFTGVSYPFSVTVGSCGGSFATGAAAFIDWNADNDFLDANEKIYSSPGTTNSIPSFTLSGNVPVPPTATVGVTRMRVIAVEGNAGAAITPCLSFNWGETEDYNVTIVASAPCTGTPVVGAAASSADSVCPATQFALSLPGLAFGTGMTFQWQSSPDNSVWTNVTGGTASFLSVASITASTYYRCIVTCTNSGLITNSGVKLVYVKPILECYCNSFPTNNTFDDIFNVTFGGLNNSSDCSTAPPSGNSTQNVFSDYSTTIAPPTIYQGLQYSFSSSISSCTVGNLTTTGLAAYVDYNRDGDFADAGEKVYTSAVSLTSPGIFSGIVTVPGAISSGITKLRVIANQGNSGAGITPCGSFNWGEVEDYALNLVVPTPCTGTPSVGITQSNYDSVCPTDIVMLSLPNIVFGTGMTFQWQSSTDNITFTNMAVASQPNVSIGTVTAARYYRCIVTCTNSGLTTNSTVKYISLKNIMNCYCKATATSTADEDIINVTISSINNTSTCASPPPSANSAQNMYSDYSGVVPPGKMYQGLQYSFASTMLSCSNNSFATGMAAFIDFNRDGDFLDANEKVYSSPGTNPSFPAFTFTGIVNVPAVVTAGLTKMRVMAVEGSTGAGITPCMTTFNWGEVEDYPINLVIPVPCTGTPITGATFSNFDSICPSDLVLLTLPNLDYALNMNFQWQSSVDNVVWTNIGAAPNAASYSFSNPAGSRWYRCVVTCTNSGLSTNSTPKFVYVKPSFACHCVSNATTNLVDDIVKTEFATMSNASSCAATAPGPNSAPSRYSNYTTSVKYPIVKRGLSYGFNMDVLACDNPNNTNGSRAFIDWNANGSLLNPGETVFTAPAFNGRATPLRVGGKVLVPTNAVDGLILLRSITQSLTTPAAVQPCGTYNYGETEDYGVQVVAKTDDIVMVSLDSPTTKCGLGTQSLYIKMYNAGSNPASNFDVAYSIDGGAPVSATYAGTINSFNYGNFQFPTPANLSTPKMYTIKVWSSLTNEGYPIDDTLTVFVENLSSVPDPIVKSDTICIGSPIAQMSAISAPGYTTLWQTTVNPSTVFQSGPTFNILNPVGPSTYWVKSVLTKSYNVGENTSNAVLGINETNTGKGLVFDVEANFLDINSVDINTSSIGNYTIQIQNSALVTVFSQSVFLMSAGTNTINLNNCRLLKGNNYRMTFVSNAGATTLLTGAGFPYVLPNILRIKNSTSGLPDQYPYFFNWKVSHGVCESNLLPVTVTYFPSPAPTQNLGKDTSFCTYPGITLDAGNPGSTYLWNDGSTLRKRYLKDNSDKMPWVRVRNPFGCNQADTINLDIRQSPTFNLGNDTTLCSGNTLILKSGYNNNGFSHTWYTNPGQYGTSIPVSTSGTYILKIDNTVLNCMYYDTIKIAFNPSPVVDLGEDTTFCNGSIQLDAGFGANYTFQWNTSETTQKINTTTTNNYIVTVTDNSFPTNCQTVDAIQVNVGIANSLNLGPDTSVCALNYVLEAPFSPNYNYDWSNGLKTNAINVNSNGLYVVMVTEKATGCVNSDTVNVSFSTITPVDLGADVTMCGNGKVLTAPSGYNSYLWSNSETTSSINVNTSGLYWVKATNNCGTKSDSINIAFETAPFVKLPNDTIICAPLTINAGSQPANNKIKWSDSSTNNSFTITKSGTYWVNVSNTCDIATDAIFVEFQEKPTIDFISKVTGNQVTFTSTIKNATSFTWYVNGSPVNQNQNPVLLFNNAGKYTILLVVKNNCGDSASKSETVDISTVSIANNLKVNSVKLYPNPTSDILFIDANGLEDGLYAIQLIDMTGKIVKSMNSLTSSGKLNESINVNLFEAGEYILRINDLHNNSINGTITIK